VPATRIDTTLPSCWNAQPRCWFVLAPKARQLWRARSAGVSGWPRRDRYAGAATHTRRFADALAGTGAQVLDTRKTTPGLRELEKYAVRCGGGTNKRMGLYDVAMVKDNHVAAAGGSVTAAVEAIRARFPGVAIQVEADTLAQAMEAIDAGADFLLLDNMPTPLLRSVVDAVRARPGHVELEATGNLTLERAAEVAGTGVDYLSVGALTHSSPILDLALDLYPIGRP